MRREKSTHHLGARTVTALVVMGLFGQIAWTIENMYFNVFLYNAVLPDTGLIALMVALSAVVATLTTLLMGALSDRLGKRREFIVLGYVFWGLSILAFRFIVPQDNLAAETLRRTAMMVILLDCVMTFFGSTANDAAFNAWVTDVTVPGNRGRAQGILSALPLISMLVVFGALDPLTQQGRWGDFFFIVALAVILAGILGAFLLKEPALSPSRESVLANVSYGFKPRVIKQNPLLYLVLAALFIQGAATQVYMPYLIIYIQNYLMITDYAIILGIVLIGAAAMTVLAGRLADRFGKARFAVPCVAMSLLGMVLMYLVRAPLGLIPAGILMIGGSMALLACVNGLVQDGIPLGMGGRFQGVRMIFAVMLPMVIGPFIGNLVITGTGPQYTELGITKQVPGPGIFLAAAVVLLFILPLIVLLIKRSKPHDSLK